MSTATTPTTDTEAAYIAGHRAALARMLTLVAGELGKGTDAAAVAALHAERLRTIAVLRELCEEFGDSDWSDDLYLPDIIEKHLARHLRDREVEREDNARREEERGQ